MIHIGKNHYGFQQRNMHTIWEHKGGKIIFDNNVILGQGTSVTVGKEAELKLGKSTHFGGYVRIICQESITIKESTIVAWDVQIVDTDFGQTINTIIKSKNRMTKPIVIGKRNWLGFGCTILKGSVTPDNCIVKAKSLIDKDFSESGENIVLGSENNVKVLAKYISWDHSAAIEF